MKSSANLKMACRVSLAGLILRVCPVAREVSVVEESYALRIRCRLSINLVPRQHHQIRALIIQQPSHKLQRPRIRITLPTIRTLRFRIPTDPNPSTKMQIRNLHNLVSPLLPDPRRRPLHLLRRPPPNRQSRLLPLPALSSSSGVSLISHPGRGSTASAPNSTSTAVMTALLSLSFFFPLRFSQMPPGRASHFSAACPLSPTAGSSRPIRTSSTTLSVPVSSSSRLRLMCSQAELVQPVDRYRSFSMRCHLSGSRRQAEKGLRLLQVLSVMSVITRPGVWRGRWLCSDWGSTR